MSRLKYLNIYGNKVSDLSPLRHLQSLEELNLGKDSIESLAVLEQLPNLRRLLLSMGQVPCLKRCKCLSAIQILEVEGDGSVKNLIDFPEMPSLKVLKLLGVKDTAGIEQFDSLSTLRLSRGGFARLNGLEKLKRLTHLDVSTSWPLSLEALNKLYALRCVEVYAPKVSDLSALARLPVLHEIDVDDETQCDRSELEALRKSLTPWGDEFRTAEKKASPSLDIEIVSQETFDYYDGKAPFGIKPGECEDGMFQSERDWLVGELQNTLEVNFKEDEGEHDDGDFLLPGTSGLRRSERLVLNSLRAYESVGEIITAVQQILCETRNDWIIYFQSLLSEGPDTEELPEDVQDFIVWIYPDRIMATKDNAAIVRDLIS